MDEHGLGVFGLAKTAKENWSEEEAEERTSVQIGSYLLKSYFLIFRQYMHIIGVSTTLYIESK